MKNNNASLLLSPPPTPTPESVLHFTEDGTGAGLYTEVIDLQQIGPLEMCRASQVEFNEATQQWEVFDYLGAHLLHTHPSRAACLTWERIYFNGGINTSETPKTLKTINPLKP